MVTIHSRLLCGLGLELAPVFWIIAQFPAMDVLCAPFLWDLFRYSSTNSQVLRSSTIWISPIYRRSHADLHDIAQMVGLHCLHPIVLSHHLYLLYHRDCMCYGAPFVQDLPELSRSSTKDYRSSRR